ncbi:ATP-binding protein [Pseudomonas lundensis]|uniref:ATP-binding protein n=1 Tax=Pseudomonas lundensis TaxID=86185 RepID=UPI0039081310
MRELPTPLIKAYYHPIEAAIRWSNLHRFELSILAHLGPRMRPNPDDFPRWPALYLNSERLYCALSNGDLPFGKRGIICQDLNLLDDPDLSICEPHLKAWMQRDYPEEKPSFLYGPAERRGLTWMALQEMSANHAALKVQLDMCAEKAAQLKERNTLLKRALAEVRRLPPPGEVLSDRGRSALLNIIGGLLTTLRGSSPGGQRYSQFDSDAAIIQTVMSYHGGRVGITERTMQKHFAAARRSLEA